MPDSEKTATLNHLNSNNPTIVSPLSRNNKIRIDEP